MKSILSSIVGKYSRHTENICSESLALVINESDSLKRCFSELLGSISNGGIALRENYTIQTQVTSKKDQAIPDLEIADGSNRKYLIEAKFWAGLTEHQPVSYLKRIENGGSLVFLAPERRLNSLGNEVCAKLGLTSKSGSANIYHDDNTSIIFISWSQVLDSLWSHALHSNEQTTLHNLFQLKTLVDTLDSKGFIPLDRQLFTPASGIQRDQMVDLLDMVVDNTPSMNTKKLSNGGGKYTYQRFFRLESSTEIPFGGYLLYSSQLWMEYQETPLFLCISHKNWNHPGDNPEVLELISKLKLAGIAHYEKKVHNDNYPSLTVPLYLLLQVSKDVEYQNLQKQVDRILEVFKG